MNNEEEEPLSPKSGKGSETTPIKPIPDEPEKEKPAIINIFILSVGMTMLFFAFNTAQGYMTTVHGNIGNICLGVIYITFAVSTFFAPVMIYYVGSKFGLILGGVCYILLIFAMGTTYDILLIVLSFVVGVGAPMVWSSHGEILTKSSGDFMGICSGVFWSIFQTNSLFGFLAMGLLKSLKISTFYSFIIYSWVGIFGILLFIFLKDRYREVKTDDKKKKIEEVKIVVASDEVVEIYDEKMSPEEKDEEEKKEVSPWKNLTDNLFATLYVCVDLKFLLMYPMIMQNGYCYGFFFGSLTYEFGEDLIAWTMACFAVCEFVGSLFFGRLTQHASNRYSFYMTMVFYIVATGYTFTLKWHVLFAFVTIAFCGLADAGSNTTAYSIIGRYYKKNSAAAFSAFKFVQSVTTAFQFYTGKVFTFFQLQMIMCGFMFCSIVSFAILDLFIQPVDKFSEETRRELNIIEWVKIATRYMVRLGKSQGEKIKRARAEIIVNNVNEYEKVKDESDYEEA